MNIGVRVSLSILVSSVCMPSSGIAGSYSQYLCGIGYRAPFRFQISRCSKSLRASPPYPRIRNPQIGRLTVLKISPYKVFFSTNCRLSSPLLSSPLIFCYQWPVKHHCSIGICKGTDCSVGLFLFARGGWFEHGASNLKEGGRGCGEGGVTSKPRCIGSRAHVCRDLRLCFLFSYAANILSFVSRTGLPCRR